MARSKAPSGDLGGGGVEFDAGEHRFGWSESQEVPRPTTRFQHPHLPLDAKVSGGGPHGRDDRRGRVVGVERGTAGLAPGFFGAEQPADLGALGGEAVVVVVEDLGDRPPPRPAGQHRLLVDIRGTVFVATSAQYVEGFEVGAQLRGGTRWGEVGLPCRPKRLAQLDRWLGSVLPCCRRPFCWGWGYRGWLMISLISARSR